MNTIDNAVKDIGNPITRRGRGKGPVCLENVVHGALGIGELGRPSVFISEGKQ